MKGKKCLRGFPADRKIVSAWKKKNAFLLLLFFGFVSRADSIRAWVRVSTADLAVSNGQGMSAW